MINPYNDMEVDMSPRKRTPDQESPEINTGASAAVAEPSATESNDNGPSFADRVGQNKRTPVPDPFGIAADYVAGVTLFEGRQDGQMAIQFGEGRPEDKPSQAVIDTVKGAGYRWNPSNRIWAHPIRSESAKGTRVEADRLFKEVCAMIRQEKGIEAEPSIPF